VLNINERVYAILGFAYAILGFSYAILGFAFATGLGK
jgi:hypothetical protein